MIRQDRFEPPAGRPRIAVGPTVAGFAVRAVEEGGGVAVAATGADLGEGAGGASGGADGLVWLGYRDPDGVRAALEADPGIRWVQLPFAGVEHEAGERLLGDGRTWTCAKGSYSEPVAEHALMLALAGLRDLPERVTARKWGSQTGASLFDQPVTILGGGGIAASLLELLAPLRVRATVVRRSGEPLEGAARTVTTDRIAEALPGALIVFVALALTPATTGIINASTLAVMEPASWLVNVARGRHVVTEDLVDALESGAIAGAALDVTDPEPLPEGHRLWDLPNCIITPHTADTWEMVRPRLAERIRENVRRFAAGEPLLGLVDPDEGY